MGLYDGAAGQGELASTAQVAKLLRAPVVLVVDASSQSRSVAALVHGFASWDPEVRIGGVILNKVASDRHEELLREALDAVRGAGAGRAAAGRRRWTTPSRHWGWCRSPSGGPRRWSRWPRWPRRCARGATWTRCSRWRAARARCRVRRGMRLRHGLAPAAPSRRVPGLRPDPASARTGLVPGRRAGRSSPSPAGPRSPSRTPSTPSCCAAAGAEVVVFDPLRDEQLPDGHRRVGHRGRLPRGVRAGAVRQRAAAQGRRRTRRERRAGGRRVRRAAVSVPGAGRAADVRGARRRRADVRAADARATGRRSP